MPLQLSQAIVVLACVRGVLRGVRGFVLACVSSFVWALSRAACARVFFSRFFSLPRFTTARVPYRHRQVHTFVPPGVANCFTTRHSTELLICALKYVRAKHGERRLPLPFVRRLLTDQKVSGSDTGKALSDTHSAVRALLDGQVMPNSSASTRQIQ